MDLSLTFKVQATGKQQVDDLSKSIKNVSSAATQADLSLKRLSTTTRVVTDGAGNVIRRYQSLGQTFAKTASGANLLGGAFDRFRATLFQIGASLGLGVGVGGIVSGFIRFNDEITQLQQRLKLVSSSSDEAGRTWDQLVQTALHSHTALQASVDLFFRLKTAQEQLGLSTSGLIGLTDTITRSIAAVGLSSDQASALVLQLGQSFSQGRLNSDEFRTVQEQLPPLLNAIAKVLNTNVGSLKALSSRGKITSAVMIAAFDDMRRHGIAAADPPRTVAGALQDMQTTIEDVLSKTGPLRDVYGDIVDALSALPGKVREAAKAFSDWANSPAMSPTGDPVRTLDLWIAKFHEVDRQLNDLAQWLESNGAGTGGQSLTDFFASKNDIDAIDRLITKLGEAWGVFDRLWTKIKEAPSNLADAIAAALPNAGGKSRLSPSTTGSLGNLPSDADLGRPTTIPIDPRLGLPVGSMPFETAAQRIAREAFERSQAAAFAHLHSRQNPLSPLPITPPAVPDLEEIKAHDRATAAIQKHIDANNLLIAQNDRLIKAYGEGSAAVEQANKAAFIENAVERANIDTKHLSQAEADKATAAIQRQAAATFDQQKRLQQLNDAQQEDFQRKQEGIQITRDFESPLATYLRQQDELNRLLLEGKISQDAFTKAIRRAREEMESRGTDFMSGLKGALDDYAKHATNAAEQAHEAFSNIFFSLEDTLVGFIETGKFKIQDFVKSTIDAITRMVVRMLILGPIFKFLSSLFTGGNQYTAPFGFDAIMAVGGIIPGLASGGTIRRGHAAIVGEDGPELAFAGAGGTIIYPNDKAHRMLHVSSIGGGNLGDGAAARGNVSMRNDTKVDFGGITVQVQGGAGGASADQAAQAQRIGVETARALKGMVVQVLQEQARPGNMLNPGIRSLT